MTETRIERLQSLSHSDLRRLLPRLFGGEISLEWSGLVYHAAYPDGRSLQISLGKESVRQLGSLRIISTPLTFIFLQWSPETLAAFMTHYERSLQQGGG
jgi:hypothetical protein